MRLAVGPRCPWYLLPAPAVGRVGRGRELEEADLPDLHARVDRDGQVRHVGELERQVAVPARVHVAGRRVDQQAEPAEARLALQARDEVVGDRDALQRGPQHELPGMQDERLVGLRLDELGEVLLLLHVDERVPVVAEHPELGGRRAGPPTRVGRRPDRTGRSRYGRRRSARGSCGRTGSSGRDATGSRRPRPSARGRLRPSLRRSSGRRAPSPRRSRRRRRRPRGAAPALSSTTSRCGPASPARIARAMAAESAASPPRRSSALARARPSSCGSRCPSRTSPSRTSRTVDRPFVVSSSRPSSPRNSIARTPRRARTSPISGSMRGVGDADHLRERAGRVRERAEEVEDGRDAELAADRAGVAQRRDGRPART